MTLHDEDADAGRHTKRAERVFLLVVVALAFGLRAWGAGFGLPYTYHPDEHQYVDSAMEVLAGRLNPERFNNPSLVKYGLGLVDGAWFVAGRLGGRYGSVHDFLARFAADPTQAYLVARWVIALLGALTVAVTYLLGRRAYDGSVGAVAAILMAGTYLHARQSHFAVSDVPATLLTTAALYFGVRVLAGETWRTYVWAGLSIGAATAAKYSSLAVAVPLVGAHVLADGAPPAAWARRMFDRRLLVAACVTVLAFLVIVPYSVIDWRAFYADVALLFERGQTGFKGLRLADDAGWVFYLKTLRWGMGLPYLLAALAALVAALARHRRIDIVLVSFPVVMYLYLGRQLLLFERFLLPVLPVLAVLTGELIRQLVVRTSWTKRAQAAAMVAATVLILVVPVAKSLRFDWLLTQTDTRSLAKEWIEANVPAGAKVLAHSNGPQLAGGDRFVPVAGRSFDVTYVGTTELGKEPLQTLVDAGQEYVVVSSYSYDRRLLDPQADARREAFYAQLDADAALLQAFRPYHGPEPPPFLFAQVYGPATDLWALDRPGPTVKVYHLVQPSP